MLPKEEAYISLIRENSHYLNIVFASLEKTWILLVLHKVITRPVAPAGIFLEDEVPGGRRSLPDPGKFSKYLLKINEKLQFLCYFLFFQMFNENFAFLKIYSEFCENLVQNIEN